MTDESRELFADFNRFHADSNVIQHPWYDIKRYQTSRLQFDLPNNFPGIQTSCIFQYRRWFVTERCKTMQVSNILVVRITSCYWWSPTKSYGEMCPWMNVGSGRSLISWYERNLTKSFLCLADIRPVHLESSCFLRQVHSAGHAYHHTIVEWRKCRARCWTWHYHSWTTTVCWGSDTDQNRPKDYSKLHEWSKIEQAVHHSSSLRLDLIRSSPPFHN